MLKSGTKQHRWARPLDVALPRARGWKGSSKRDPEAASLRKTAWRDAAPGRIGDGARDGRFSNGRGVVMVVIGLAIAGSRRPRHRTRPARPAPRHAMIVVVNVIEEESRSSPSVPALYNQAVERTGVASSQREGRAERRFCAPFARRGTRAGRSPLR